MEKYRKCIDKANVRVKESQGKKIPHYEKLQERPWTDSSVSFSVVPILQGCGFHPWSPCFALSPLFPLSLKLVFQKYA